MMSLPGNTRIFKIWREEIFSHLSIDLFAVHNSVSSPFQNITPSSLFAFHLPILSLRLLFSSFIDRQYLFSSKLYTFNQFIGYSIIEWIEAVLGTRMHSSVFCLPGCSAASIDAAHWVPPPVRLPVNREYSLLPLIMHISLYERLESRDVGNLLADVMDHTVQLSCAASVCPVCNSFGSFSQTG